MRIKLDSAKGFLFGKSRGNSMITSLEKKARKVITEKSK